MTKKRAKCRVRDLATLKQYRSTGLGQHRGEGAADKPTSLAKPRISYSGKRTVQDGLPEVPILVPQGIGGSFRMDLRGLGITISPLAFAFSVPDDNLAGLRICRGDIAILEPTSRTLRAGDLVLVTDDGLDRLRRVTKVKGVWYLQTNKGDGPELFPLWQYGYQGVVLGVLRLFRPPLIPTHRTTSKSPRRPERTILVMPLNERDSNTVSGSLSQQSRMSGPVAASESLAKESGRFTGARRR
jgi:hypothetical protein